MATLTTTRTTSGTTSARFVHEGVYSDFVSYSFTANPSAGDVVQLFRVPRGARVLDLQVVCNRASEYGVGDGNDDNRFIATAAVAAATVAGGVMINAGLNYEYTADDTIDLTIASASATTDYTFKAQITLSVDGSSVL